jgi:hypothetical protein
MQLLRFASTGKERTLILPGKFPALATNQCVQESTCSQSELTNLGLREAHPIDIEMGADKIANPGY